jgi:acyl-CoA dehydrogenase
MAELLAEEEMELLIRSIRSFVRETVVAAEQGTGSYLKTLPREVLNRLQRMAQGIGIQALGAKKVWGGAELSLFERTVLLEEASQHRFGIYHPAADAFGGEFPSFLEECNEQQIERFIKPAIKNGKGCFLAVWEDQEDNHLERLSTSAVHDGNGWLVNGHKSYIQNLEQAAFGVILVNCQMENGEYKPTLFLLELDENLEMTKTDLIDVQTTVRIRFKNYKLSDSQRISAIGEGEAFIKNWLAESQILLASRCIGISVKALEYGKQYANSRITRGKLLSEFPTIRTMLAKGNINLQSARLMVQDAAKKADKRAKGWELAAQMAKLQATETASKIIDDVLQIHGGSGFAGDLPIERWYKEIRIARLNLLKSETIIENIADDFL